MSSAMAYNRLRGRGLYLEVHGIFAQAAGPLTNRQVLDMLRAKYPDAASSDAFLEDRVARATAQMFAEGRLKRTEEVGPNKHIIYIYTHVRT